MEQELKETGPVFNGDTCIMLAATTLDLIADAFPPGTQWNDETTKEALRHYQAVITYYPGTDSAAEASAAIDQL